MKSAEFCMCMRIPIISQARLIPCLMARMVVSGMRAMSARSLLDGALEVGAGDDLVDDPPLLGLLGRERLAR